MKSEYVGREGHDGPGQGWNLLPVHGGKARHVRGAPALYQPRRGRARRGRRCSPVRAVRSGPVRKGTHLRVTATWPHRPCLGARGGRAEREQRQARFPHPLPGDAQFRARRGKRESAWSYRAVARRVLSHRPRSGVFAPRHPPPPRPRVAPRTRRGREETEPFGRRLPPVGRAVERSLRALPGPGCGGTPAAKGRGASAKAETTRYRDAGQSGVAALGGGAAYGNG